jgi:hypothetical protein
MGLIALADQAARSQLVRHRLPHLDAAEDEQLDVQEDAANVLAPGHPAAVTTALQKLTWFKAG